MNLVKLSLSYIRRQTLNTLLNVLLLGLGIGTIVLLILFSNQFGEKLERDAQGIDMVVGAKGSPMQLILSGIYHMDVPTGNIPLSEFERLKQNRMIAKAIPLSLGDSYQQFRIVGSTAEYPEHYGAAIATGRMFSNVKEVVLGATVARQSGMDVGSEFTGAHGLVSGGEGHDDHPFEVTGILEATGTVLDKLILTSLESVWDVHGLLASAPGSAADSSAVDTHASSEHTVDAPTQSVPPPGMGGMQPMGPPGQEITLALVQFATPIAAISLPRYINTQTNMQAARPAEQMANLLQLVGVGLDTVRAFGFILIITAALSVFIALYNAMKQRRYDLAIMRSLGASRVTLLWHVLIEGVLYAAMGTALGLLLGHGAAEIVGTWLARNQSIELTGLTWASDEIWIVLLAFGVGLASALIPALRAYRTDIAETLAR